MREPCLRGSGLLPAASRTPVTTDETSVSIRISTGPRRNIPEMTPRSAQFQQVPKGVADLAAVQSYDSKALSSGAMQKIIDTDGTGELPKLLARFKELNPTKYKSLFADKGWTVETEKINPKTGKTMNINPTAYFKDPNDPKMQPITGSALQQYIRQCDGANWEKTMKPWRDAGKDPDFQSQQIKDFNQRIKDTRNAQFKIGKAFYRISDFVTSSRGTAQITDESVNAGSGSPIASMARTVRSFYQENPTAPPNPATWTDEQRQEYEPRVLQLYKENRGAMTDADDRWKRIQDSPCLSDNPGSI